MHENKKYVEYEKNDSSKQHTNKLWPKILSFCSIMEMLSRHRCLPAVENQTNHKVIHMNRAMPSDYILLTCIHKHKHKNTHNSFEKSMLHWITFTLTPSFITSFLTGNIIITGHSPPVTIITNCILLDLFAESQHRMLLQHVLIIWPAVHRDLRI